MKILYLTDVFPPHCGGSGWSVYYFARELRKRQHEVQILALDGVPRTYDGFAVQGLESGRNKSTLGNWWRKTAGSRDLASMVQKSAQNFDLIHAHHKLSILAAAQTGFPFFATVRDY